MVELLCAVIGILLIVIFFMALKIYYLRRSAREITEIFAERLTTDTNTLVDISSRDKVMRELAGSINEELKLLRKQRRKYLNGDRELKDAVTNISHDLRTPLTAICGYLDLLKRKDKSEDVANYLSYIENRAQVLKQLTEELFRYSVILSTDSEMTLSPMSLNGLLEESIMAYYGALGEKGITPELKIPDEFIMRDLNRQAMTRVFGNILGNVIKYSDGDLTIELKECGEVVFTNTASKLDEIQVGRLFDRFYSVEATRNSTGLGLSIAKTLVEQMNGKITADYKDGKLGISILFAKHET